MMDRYQKIYDRLKEELLKLQKRLDVLEKDENVAIANYNKAHGELSDKIKGLDDLKTKASFVKPKELDEEFINLKRGKLCNRVLWLFVPIYSLICLMILTASLLLIPSALMVLAVIGVSSIFASIFGNKAVEQVVDKIIKRQIENAKNSIEGKEYFDICKQIEEFKNEVNIVMEKENCQFAVISELYLKKDGIIKEVRELEDMICSLEELERKYVLDSVALVDNKSVKKRTLK